jgi:hypothetical protein
VAIDHDGSLSVLGADGVVAVPRQSPRDLDFRAQRPDLYEVSQGSATDGGSVTGYRLGNDGSLTEITSAPAVAGITAAAAY